MTDHCETIIDAMVTAFGLIATGSGDSFTPSVVQRLDRFNSTVGVLPNIQVRRADYRKSREDFGGNWRCDLFVEVLLLIDADETGATATDKQVSIAAGDVEGAVIGMDWETLKANYANVETTPLVRENEEEPDNGMLLTFQVQYTLAFEDLSIVVDPA